MHACVVMMVGMMLLGSADSLHIEHHREPVKDEENVRMVAGVRMYDNGCESNGQYIIQLKPPEGSNGAQSVSEACESSHCIDSSNSSTGPNIIVVEAESYEELGQKLQSISENVVQAEPDCPCYAENNDKDYSQYLIDEVAAEGAATWGLNAINKDSAVADGFGVHAYVYDTGVRTTHAQFTGRGIPTLDAVSGQLIVCNCQNTSCAYDTHGHGTHCAGTIAGIDYGVAPKARVHAVKVLSDSGSGYTSWQIDSHNWLIANGMQPAVVSMSLGGSGNSAASKTAIDAVVAAGITVVVAAGNSNADACGYSPAFIPNAITVGSTTYSNAMSYFSNYGTCLDIWAPGSSVLSCGVSSDTATSTKSGTSMACPHVAGGVAILQDLLPSITPAQVNTQLLAGAVTGLITGIPASPASPDQFLQVNTLTVPR